MVTARWGASSGGGLDFVDGSKLPYVPTLWEVRLAGIGEALRSTRERRGLSIDEVARETRISPRFLEALEAEAFDELPAPVYVRGFLRSYANYLKIEPQPLLDLLVGGDVAMPKAAGGYVGGGGRELQNLPRRNDPFQRSGVVAAPPTQAKPKEPGPEPAEDDAWAPEPLAPFTPPPQDHGYVPGSDLMEAPEYAQPEPFQYEEYGEPEPVYTPRFERRQAGVLAERPGGPSDPGSPRRLLVLAGGVVAVLVFLAVAVLLTRSDGEGNVPANAAGGAPTTGTTPGTMIALGTKTVSPTASASVSASATTTPSATASVTTTPGTATPSPTAGPGTPTATASPTTVATIAPTATPTTVPPTATPTRPPVISPASLGLGECQAVGGTYDCGNGPFRVICYAPINQSLNKNWWVDINWDFGPIPTDQGWQETTVNGTVGDIITAGAAGCD